MSIISYISYNAVFVIAFTCIRLWSDLGSFIYQNMIEISCKKSDIRIRYIWKIVIFHGNIMYKLEFGLFYLLFFIIWVLGWEIIKLAAQNIEKRYWKKVLPMIYRNSKLLWNTWTKTMLTTTNVNKKALYIIIIL